jgi:hypothetical protein
MENELDVDALISAMNSPQTGDNAKDIFVMLEKADEVLQKVEIVIGRLDRMGIKPLLIRALGKQLGIDPETPLKSDTNYDVVKMPAVVDNVQN